MDGNGEVAIERPKVEPGARRPACAAGAATAGQRPEERPRAAPAKRVVALDDLPKPIGRLLEWLPREEWELVHTAICRLPLSKNLVELARFVDSVWFQGQRAEQRTFERIRGAEMDEYRDRIDRAVGEIVEVSLELCRRARLTQIRHRFRRLLERNGHAERDEPGPARTT